MSITNLSKHHRRLIVVAHKGLMSYLSWSFVEKLTQFGIVMSIGVSVGIATVLVELFVELYLDEQVTHLFSSWEQDKEEAQNAEHSAKNPQ